VSEAYDAWAIYYDWIHQGLPGEADFYRARTRKCPTPVLELGTGTGRIALDAAAHGARIIGLDISAAMLALCREKLRLAGPLPGGVHLVRADMRHFSFACSFGAIFMPYRTFMHLLSDEDALCALRCVRAHLAPGGEFVLNLWAAPPKTLIPVIRQPTMQFTRTGQYACPDPDTTLQHYFRCAVDAPRRLLIEDHRVEECSPAGEVRRRVDIPMIRRWYRPRHIKRLLSQAGFTAYTLHGGFDAEPFSPTCSEMVWIARRD